MAKESRGGRQLQHWFLSFVGIGPFLLGYMEFHKVIMGWELPGLKFTAQGSLSSFSRLKDQVALVAIYPHTQQFEEYWALPSKLLCYLSATNKC